MTHSYHANPRTASTLPSSDLHHDILRNRLEESANSKAHCSRALDFFDFHREIQEYQPSFQNNRDHESMFFSEYAHNHNIAHHNVAESLGNSGNQTGISNLINKESKINSYFLGGMGHSSPKANHN